MQSNLNSEEIIHVSIPAARALGASLAGGSRIDISRLESLKKSSNAARAPSSKVRVTGLMDGDDETQLPRATLVKLFKTRLISSGQRVAPDTVTLLSKAASEFIQMLSSECLEIVQANNRTKIKREHLEQACTNMGFEHYIEELRTVGDEANEIKAEKGKKWKSSKTPEELQAAQQALFAKAAAARLTAPIVVEQSPAPQPSHA